MEDITGCMHRKICPISIFTAAVGDRKLPGSEDAATTLFHGAGGLPSPQQMDEQGIPAFPAAKCCPESLVPADLCRVCKFGGVICHSLKIPASP